MREPVTGSGSDTDAHAKDWTERMAHLMTRANGNRVYGDVGYWSELRCSVVGAERCAAAVAELFVTLEQHAPEHVHKIFGANALRCFPVRAPA